MRIDRVKFATELTKKDMTLTKLSELSGVSRISLSNIKSGKSCSDATGEKIAKALNVSIEKLI